LVVVPAHGRAQDPHRVTRGAAEVMPRATVLTLPGATHHTLPSGAERAVTEFLR
jgi:hypothetical protein